jgi:hypothetical protein
VKIISSGLRTVAQFYGLTWPDDDLLSFGLTLEQDAAFVKQMTIDTMVVDPGSQELAAEVLSASCTYPMSTTPPTTGTLSSVTLPQVYSDVSIPPPGEYEITCSLLTVSFGTINMGSYTLNGAQLGG